MLYLLWCDDSAQFEFLFVAFKIKLSVVDPTFMLLLVTSADTHGEASDKCKELCKKVNIVDLTLVFRKNG